MFIMTAKFNKKKAVALVLLLGIVLVAIIFIAGGASRAGRQAQEARSLDSNEGRLAYLEAYGWSLDPEPLEVQQVRIPQAFPDVYAEYNTLQLEQGFDLTQYAGMEATRYTYQVLNYPDLPTGVVADILVCGDTVIAGDVQSFALDGFMQGLAYPQT